MNPTDFSLEEAQAQWNAIELEVARRKYLSLRAFVEDAWPLIEPDKPFVGNWHIDTGCQILESVSKGAIKRVVWNVPPGTMKSLLVSVFWPAWEWTQHPEYRYLTASNGSTLTLRDNGNVRLILGSEWYQKHWPKSKLLGEQKERLEMTRGGWRIATSVGGVGIGEHPDRIIIDDPLKAQQARSDVERENANRWFDRTISTRGVTRDTAIVVIMQRLHTNDLSGHLLAKGGWTHVCWPMRFEPERADPRDPRTEPGELLWPSLFTPDLVRAMELDLGPYGSAGQLQQRPAPEGGGLFKRNWFSIVDSVPSSARRFRGWDTAGTEDGGDWTVGVRIAEHKGIFYIEDVVRDRLGPGGVDDLILNVARADGVRVGQREEKEGGSAGAAVIAARAKTLVGYDYAGVQVSGDKVTRAKPFRAQCEAGNVRLVAGPWNEVYLQELEYFPVGGFDDQVDGSSCAFNALLLDPPYDEVTW